MIDAFKFARPYAKAAFEYAEAHRQLGEWKTFLQAMAERLSQPQVLAILQSPHAEVGQCIKMCIALAQGQLGPAGENFIKMLVEKRRITVLPQIYQLFEEFRAAAEKNLTVQVKSAIPLTAEYCQKLTTLLNKKYSAEIILECHVDPALIGGLLISAGDHVIDGTVRGQLLRLKDTVVQ